MTNPDFELDDYSELDERRVLTVPAECAGMRLDAALAQLIPDFSRSRLTLWIKDGLVDVDGQTITAPKHKLWGGEALAVTAQPNPDEIAFTPEDIALDVLYDDDAIIIINKPAGLVVHPGSGNWSGTLLNALLFHYPELKTVPRAGIVHRLDKDTSGLMVVARTLSAQNNLVQQLQARTVKRHYLAVAQGQVGADGTVDAPIGRHPRDRVKMAVVHTGKPAITHYRVLERFNAHTLVECRLETGRTHQIRVHMAHIGHPLAADSVYNARPVKVSPEVDLALEDLARQALHARKLALVHPETGKTMQWKAPIPADFDALLAALRFDAHPDDDEDEDWDDDDDDHDCEIIYVRD
ncbi:23S rRNA pseudouridine(1911/1915/1917) synthase RluD [Chitinilyticum piscinae]|uniref:Pseudouridine synthase n=1 Tax=Chitinilyticum piscinae TaxID=2866724 RepID=A0A8J7FQD5_9NEIS|nr:23S rRNA pseudouridine(1911/1915/1917) synthase RluD [Chitinilyticum piscinae]MBE9610349.1 23S rRNA pseudouridine(1911/1915/1917) synthase RluD [Chitinilyticum piscinae]